MPSQWEDWSGRKHITNSHVRIPANGKSLSMLRKALVQHFRAGTKIRAIGAFYSFSECNLPDRASATVWWRPFGKALDERGVNPAARLRRWLNGNDTHLAQGLALGLPPPFSSALGALLNWNTGAHAYALVGPAVRVDDLCVAAKWLRTCSTPAYVAPITLGGSTGQTFIGAMSTGTHGADWDEGPVADSVDAIHLHTGKREFWIQRPGGPIDNSKTRISELRAFLKAPQLEFFQSERVLDAARVAVGHAGVILSALVRLRNTRFGDAEELMNERWVELPWSLVRSELERGFAGARYFRRPPSPLADPAGVEGRYLELMPNPYADPPTCFVISRVTRRAGLGDGGDPDWSRPDLPVKKLIDVLAKASAGEAPAALRAIVRGTRHVGTDAAGKRLVWAPTSKVIRGGIPGFLPVVSYGLALPMTTRLAPTSSDNLGELAYVRLLDDYIDSVRRRGARAIATVRISRRTRIPLAMQCGGPSSRHAQLELNFLRFDDDLPAQAAAVMSDLMKSKAVTETNIRAHWGLEIDHRVEHLAQVSRYGANLTRWKRGMNDIHGQNGIPAAWRSKFTQQIGL